MQKNKLLFLINNTFQIIGKKFTLLVLRNMLYSNQTPVRAQMRGPQEFIDTVKKIRKAFSEVHYEELETIATQLKIKLFQLWP
jgi:hypothetical protein